MKSKTYKLSHEQARENCIEFISGLELDGSKEVIIRQVKSTKTLEQLGGIFGVWIAYISDKTGESQHEIHKRLKDYFLARIYVTEPIGPIQEQWVELLANYQETGQQAKLIRHAERISLKWATLNQVSEYMEAIQNHYIYVGMPLPMLDKFRKYKKTPAGSRGNRGG